MSGVRLEWEGKSAEVPRLRLPLQVVETVNASRADRGSLFEGATPDQDSWRNRLIWGDNLHALASLADQLAGQVDLVYIDPPFDSRQDYKVRIAVGDGGDAPWVLRKKGLLPGHLTIDEYLAGCRGIDDLGVAVVPTDVEAIEQAAALCASRPIDFFDAMFVVRALHTGRPLLTADVRLAHGAGDLVPVTVLDGVEPAGRS